MTSFALGDVVLVGLSTVCALTGAWAAEAWVRGGADPVPLTRAAAVAGALLLALWETAGRGPQITLTAILGLLLVALLALAWTETLTIVMNPTDDRDPRGWIAAVVGGVVLGVLLTLLS